MKDRWEHNGVVYVDAHEIIKELEKENKNLKEENEKFYKIIQTLSADNQRFRARLDMLGEKE